MARFLRFEHVSFQYPGMTKTLLSDVDAHFSRGWTGIVGPNGAGKTTFLRLATGGLEPSSGTIHHLSTGLYAVQRTDDPPEGLEDFIASKDAVAIWAVSKFRAFCRMPKNAWSVPLCFWIRWGPQNSPPARMPLMCARIRISACRP